MACELQNMRHSLCKGGIALRKITRIPKSKAHFPKNKGHFFENKGLFSKNKGHFET
jgi:hypothetical protein